MEAVVLHRVGFLAYPCPKRGQDFKPSAAPLHPNMGQVPPPPRLFANLESKDYIKYLGVLIDKNLSWKFHIDAVASKSVKLSA